MKDGETRTLRVDIPSDLANLLDQCKVLTGRKKKEAVVEALHQYFDHRLRSTEKDPDRH